MHLHGYNMYILHEGPGQNWDGTIVRPENPQRRDVFQIRPNGHLVMQFDAAENPGKLSIRETSLIQSSFANLVRRLALPLPYRVARLWRIFCSVPC